MKIVKKHPYPITEAETGPTTKRPAVPKVINKPANGGKRTKHGKAAA